MRTKDMRSARRGVVLACMLLLGLAALPGFALAAEFVRVGDLLQGRDMGMAATLPDGRVLVTGGVGLDDEGNGTYLAASELFDPQTDTFVPTGTMGRGRDGNATITPLLDGRVLVTGGIGRDAEGNNVALSSAEVYDPATGAFTPTANDMATVRFFHAASRLADGRVLVVGGWGSGERLASAELYDPVSNRFTTTGDMTSARNSHTATTLQDGRVLIVGGLTIDAYTLDTAELYDPLSGQFEATGSLADPRFMATASRLADGRVLVGGGLDNGAWRPHGELYDPATGTFERHGEIHWSRHDHAQTSLPDGRVLFTAGLTDEGSTRRAERFDPVTGTFTMVANMQLGRGRAATAVLADGRVLVAGGVRPWEPPLAYAETYVPNAGPYVDLDLALNASNAEVVPGQPFQYVLTLANRGTRIARNVALDVELPERATVTGYKVFRYRLDPPWRCGLEGNALSCTPLAGNLRVAPPASPAPAVTIRIDAVAPAQAPEVPLFATAIASTSSNEDITANNEGSTVVGVIDRPKAYVPAARPIGQGRVAEDRVQRAAIRCIAR